VVDSVLPDHGERPGGGRRVVARQLVVIEPARDFAQQAGALGFAVLERRQLAALGFSTMRLRLPAGMSGADGQQLLHAHFPGLVVDYNDLYEPQGTLSLPAPDYPRRQIGWGLPSADCGAGQQIGLIDTPIDRRAPALAAARIRQRNFAPAAPNGADTAHGTAIAALLVGRPDGISSGLLPGASLLATQVYSPASRGDLVADAIVFASALDWLMQQDVHVINLSLAGRDNLLMRLAVARAAARGVIMIAAAGNEGPDAGPVYPAAYPGVIAAAAVDARRNADPGGNRGDYIAFAAPGMQVWVPTADGGRYYSGSSFAASFVTAAVVSELMVGLPPDRAQLEKKLAADAIDLGPAGRDPIFGWGLLQARPRCATASALAQ
jgi:subtilisin family serine protease